MTTFSPRSFVPGVARETSEFFIEAFRQISDDLTELRQGPKLTALLRTDYVARENDYVRCAPPIDGMSVLLPQSRSQNSGKSVAILIETTLGGGGVTVTAIGGLLNGLESITLTAVGLVEFVSDGLGNWVSAYAPGSTGPEIDAVLALPGFSAARLPSEPRRGFPGAQGTPGGQGPQGPPGRAREEARARGPVGFLLQPGDSLARQGNEHTLGYVGTASNINITPVSGSLGVIDISTLKCGGSVTLQSLAEADIAGFSVPPNDGFWFALFIRDSTTSDSVSILENSGNTTTSIRTPDTRDWRLTKNEGAFLYYSNTRWRLCAHKGKLWLTPSDSVTWASQQDNFTRSSRGISNLRVTLTGNQTLTGIVPDGATPNGELLLIENLDSVDSLTLTHDATSTAANRFFLPNSVNLVLGPRHSALLRYDGTSSRWRTVSTSGNHGRLVAVTRYTSGNGTHTYHPEARTADVEMVGQGGGGGGVAVAEEFGGGGAAGSYHRFYITTLPASSAYSVGDGGGAGGAAATSGDGGAGDDTTFVVGGETYTAHGGPGGHGGGDSEPGESIRPSALTYTTVNSAGGNGGWGMYLNDGVISVNGGHGGDSFWGGGGLRTDNATGEPGNGPGAGGSGGSSFSGTDRQGGAGADGLIIVREYS